MIKKMGSIALSLCMVLGSLVVQPKTVKASNLNIAGTLSNVGDSVCINIKDEKEPVVVKYVSSTNETVCVYSDSESDDPYLVCYSEDMNCFGGFYDSNIKKNSYCTNVNNFEFLINVKKGKVYYFYCYGQDNTKYNIKLANAVAQYSREVTLACRQGEILYTTIDLCENPNPLKGIYYNEAKNKLTINNYNGVFGIEESETVCMLSDRPDFEIEVLGNNTLYSYGWGFFRIGESIRFSGDGTLNLKCDSNYASDVYTMISSSKNVCIDGPNIKADIKDVTSCNYVIDCVGLVYNSGNLSVGSECIDAAINVNFMEMNGGEININKNKGYLIVSAENFEMNGGILRLNYYSYIYEDEDEKYENYNMVIYAYKKFIVNKGTIIIDYHKNEKDLKCKASPTIGSGNIHILGGNIYLIMPNDIKKILDGKYISYTGVEHDTSKVYYISDKANIQVGEKINMANVKMKLAQTSFKYDGKAKKPKVIIEGLKEGLDYTVSYKNNVNAGKGDVIVTGKGLFAGRKVLNFDIINETKKGARASVSNYIYKITKRGSKKKAGRVSVIGLSNKKLKKIKIASTVNINGIKYKVTSIGKKAFKNNKKIKNVIIGKNVKKIGKQAFYKCKKLKKITIKSKKLKKIGKNAFKGTSKKLVVRVPRKMKVSYSSIIANAGNKKVKVK